MRLNSALTFIFLFVSAALSGPLRERVQSRWIPGAYNNATDGGVYSLKDAGAYWEETDGGFTFATATFNVPAQSAQSGYTLFVSIGDVNGDSTLWAGIDIVTDNSETTYQAWCHLGNSDVYNSSVIIAPNDVVRISITALNATSGVVLTENINNGQADVLPLVDSTQSLMGQQVVWGVELDHWTNDIIPFDKLTITNANAYGPSGRKNYETRKFEINRNAKVVASVETKESNITIQHVHE